MKLGFGEILMIIIVILFVIGPDKIPDFARKFGEGLKAFRTATSGVTKEIRENVIEPLNEAAAPLREAMEPINEMRNDINAMAAELQHDMQGITDDLNREVQNLSDDISQEVQAVSDELNKAGAELESAARGEEIPPEKQTSEEAEDEASEAFGEAGKAAAKEAAPKETVMPVPGKEADGEIIKEAEEALRRAREEAERKVAEAEKALREAQEALTKVGSGTALPEDSKETNLSS
ncbi:MAG: twin-arginine translocase TatA/TatE family subunit [Lachnospiraceae bacterium]|nr:twin-arginine translocase TatA/TatE family subunit [Lachnospiraceae bacterium]